MAKRERPILFSGEMVRAILEGRKSQTRRVVIPQPTRFPDAYHDRPGSLVYDTWNWAKIHQPATYATADLLAREVADRSPYGKPGDQLWVRETFMHDGAEGRNEFLKNNGMTPKFIYRATDARADGLSTMFKWKPSIFMPRWASRINLEITEVRVERIQEITETDAISEGRANADHPDFHRGNFRDYWDKLNKKRGFGWETNCWVWVIEFKKYAGEIANA